MRRKNRFPHRLQFRQSSLVGQSTSSCPRLLRRHLPHHVGVWSVWLSASVTVHTGGGVMVSLLNRHCGDRWLRLWQYVHCWFGRFQKGHCLRWCVLLPHSQHPHCQGSSCNCSISRGPQGHKFNGRSDGECVGLTTIRAYASASV